MKAFKAPSKKKLIVWAAVLVCLAVFCVVNNKYLTVTEYGYTDTRIKNGFRIVHISDLHNAEFGSDNKRLIERIRSLDPDIIAVTGDLVDGSHTDIDVGIDFCKACAEICPTYYVTGNHEHWLDEEVKNRMTGGMFQEVIGDSLEKLCDYVEDKLNRQDETDKDFARDFYNK